MRGADTDESGHRAPDSTDKSRRNPDSALQEASSVTSPGAGAGTAVGAAAGTAPGTDPGSGPGAAAGTDPGPASGAGSDSGLSAGSWGPAAEGASDGDRVRGRFRAGAGAGARVAGVLLRRVALLVVLLALTYSAVGALPGDAARATLDPSASASEVAARRSRLGLDQPVFVRFLHWLGGLATGDLGTSARGRPVSGILRQSFPDTLLLGTLALALTLLVALALGCAAVLRPGGRLDGTVSAAATAVTALPVFVVATVLIVVLALWLPLLPAVTGVSGGGLAASPETLVLPVLALALPQTGWNTRIVRAALTEQLRAPHVDAALLDGLTRRRVLLHHMLPGAAPTIASGVATSVGMLLGGAVPIEAVFNFPGMGSVLTEALHDRDATLVTGVVGLTGLTVTVVLVLADLLRARAVRGKP